MRKEPQPISGTTPLQNIKKPSPPPAPPPLREGKEVRCGTNPPPSSPRPTTPPPGQGGKEIIDHEKLLTRLLLKVNRVTCYHRHGNPIPNSALDELAQFQEELEDLLEQ